MRMKLVTTGQRTYDFQNNLFQNLPVIETNINYISQDCAVPVYTMSISPVTLTTYVTVHNALQRVIYNLSCTYVY